MIEEPYADAASTGDTGPPREDADPTRAPSPELDPAAAARAGTAGEQVCPDCSGDGRIGAGECATCEGTGTVIAPVGGG